MTKIDYRRCLGATFHGNEKMNIDLYSKTDQISGAMPCVRKRISFVDRIRCLSLVVGALTFSGFCASAVAQVLQPPTNLRIDAGTCAAQPYTPGGSDGQGSCFPGPANTGVPQGTALTNYTGSCTITAANTVIDAKTVNCSLTIRAAGVKISRSVVNGTVYADPNTSASFTISDSQINIGNGPGTGIGDGNFTALRVHVTGGNRSMNCFSNCTAESSYVHGQFRDATGTYHESGIRMGSNGVIRGNTIACDAPDVPPDAGCSAAITGYGDFAVVQNMLVDGNLIIAGSGGYCAYGGSTKGKPYSNGTNNIRYTNNVWQRGSNGRGCYYGPITAFDVNAPGNVWSNNKFDNGTAVQPAN